MSDENKVLESMGPLQRAHIELTLLVSSPTYEKARKVMVNVSEAAEGASEIPKAPISGVAKLLTGLLGVVGAIATTPVRALLDEVAKRHFNAHLVYHSGEYEYEDLLRNIGLESSIGFIETTGVPVWSHGDDDESAARDGGARATLYNIPDTSYYFAVYTSGKSPVSWVFYHTDTSREEDHAKLGKLYRNFWYGVVPQFPTLRVVMTEDGVRFNEYHCKTGHIPEESILAVADEVAVFRRMGQTPSFLFWGLPGTGKTSFAIALGNMISNRTIVATRDQLSNAVIRSAIKHMTPGCLIIDEVDKNATGLDAENAYTNLLELKGSLPNIVFIMTANVLSVLGPAFLRPERAGVLRHFVHPTKEEKVACLKSAMSAGLMTDETLSELVEGLPEHMTHDWVDKLGRYIEIRWLAAGKKRRIEDVAKEVTSNWVVSFELTRGQTEFSPLDQLRRIR